MNLMNQLFSTFSVQQHVAMDYRDGLLHARNQMMPISTSVRLINQPCTRNAGSGSAQVGSPLLL